MEQLITQIIARVLIVYGLLVSAFVLSNILEIKELADVREYAASIFSTNCFFLGNSLLIQSIVTKLVSESQLRLLPYQSYPRFWWQFFTKPLPWFLQLWVFFILTS